MSIMQCDAARLPGTFFRSALQRDLLRDIFERLRSAPNAPLRAESSVRAGAQKPAECAASLFVVT